jgi:uncharacterized protein YbjT (DUF2867 family)
MAGNVILVTGATGQQGGATARELLANNHSVRAMTRNPDGDAAKALAAAGAEIVRGDLDDAASVSAALAGAWGAFAVQNTWEAGVEKEEEQGKRFAQLAKEAGVQHLVYSSVGSANRNTGVPHFDNKARVEQVVAGLGFPSYVILRPVFFMENLSNPYLFLPKAENDYTLAVAMPPQTKLQMVAVADIGKYGHLAFDKYAELNGQAIDFAGDELTMPEAAAVIGKAMGREVKHFQVNIEDVRSFSEDMALMFEWFISTGYNADIASQQSKYGIKPTSFKDWAASASW